ncbi:MAG: hypothetical protein HY814_14850 [Candidatus Riflebacteria bacterium]|nr:hypothetical protein [Candidatus Riflebacteria bacterium]
MKALSAFWPPACWLLLAALATSSCPAAPPKAVAPVELQLAALDPIVTTAPVRLQLTAVPRVDAPVLRLTWLLPAGVASQGEGTSWSGTATAGTTASLVVRVLLPDLSPRTFIAGATLEFPNGSRQVRTATLELPSGARSKAPTLQPVTHDSRGQALLEHVVPARSTPAAPGQ